MISTLLFIMSGTKLFVYTLWASTVVYYIIKMITYTTNYYLAPQIASYEDKLIKIRRENIILEDRVASYSSQLYLKSRAADLGFTENASQHVMYIQSKRQVK